MDLSRGKLFILWCITGVLCIAQATALSCGAQITQDTVLEQDLDCQALGLILNHSQITLDCQGHRISGYGLGNGIHVVGSNVLITNCHVEGFENAVVLQNADRVQIQHSTLAASLIGASLFDAKETLLSNNLIANNSFYGVYAKDSPASQWQENTFFGNREDAYEFINPVEEPPLIKDAPEPVVVPERDPQEQIKPREPITQIINVRLSQEQSEKIDAQKKVTIEANRTTYQLDLRAKKGLGRVEITEEIPYEVAQTSQEISSDTPFNVVKEGTERKGPVLRFVFTDLEAGDQRVVRYQISKEVLSEFALRPTTFILLEEAINPSSLWAIRVLFSVFLILLAAWIYLLKRLHAHRHYGMYLSVFIICVVVFVALNATVEIVLTEFANNLFIGTSLTILIVLLGIADVRNAIKLRQLPKEKQEIEDMEL